MAFDVASLPAFDAKRDVSKYYTKLVLNTKMSRFMRLMDGIKTDKDIPDITHSYDILQQGSCDRTVKGTTTFGKTGIHVDKFMIAEDWCIEDLDDTLVQLSMRPGINSDELPPAIKPTIVDVLNQAVGKALELGLWRADKSLGGGSFLATFTGLNKRIDEKKVSGELPADQITTFTPSLANIIEKIEDIYDSLSIDTRFSDTESRFKLFMSWQNLRLYRKAYRADHSGLNYNDNFNKTFIDGTNIELVTMAGLDGEDKMVLADPNNLILGADLAGEENAIRFYPDVHELKVHATGQSRIGTQVQFGEEIAVANY